MTTLASLVALFGLSLPFTPGQLSPIKVEIVTHPIYTESSPRGPQIIRALAISCERGVFEGASCPDVDGPVIVVDATLMPTGYWANVLTHEMRNITTGGWDVDAYTFACAHEPVPACTAEWERLAR